MTDFTGPLFFKTWVLRYVEWIIGHRYNDIAPMNTACRANCPILLVHGTADQTVPVSDVYAIQNNCPDKCLELLLVEDAGHDSVGSIECHADQLVLFLRRKNLL